MPNPARTELLMRGLDSLHSLHPYHKPLQHPFLGTQHSAPNMHKTISRRIKGSNLQIDTVMGCINYLSVL